MKKVQIILMGGKTGTGKTTVADEVARILGTERIKSYATRPMRPGENEKTDHYFISKDDVEKYRDDIAAYTEINGFEYFTTWSMLKASDGYVYVIDPVGIEYLKETVKKAGLDDVFDFKVVYITTDADVQMRRLIERGDDAETIASRMKSEAAQFERFERENKDNPDVLFVDNSGDLNESVEAVLKFLKKKETSD